MNSIANLLTGDHLIWLSTVALTVVVVSVVYAALKHAIIKQLESKIENLNKVLQENTENIANKKKLLEAKTEAHDEIKASLQDLSQRHQSLRHEFNDKVSVLNTLETNHQVLKKNHENALTTIEENKKLYKLEKSLIKKEYNEELQEFKDKHSSKMEKFKENHFAEFEHLKKSHKRLVQANKTMSNLVENLRSERDFYLSEFQTLRDFLHNSQIDKAKELSEKHSDMIKKRASAETDKIVEIMNKLTD